MVTVSIYGITFGVIFETLINTDRIFSCSDFNEIFNIEVISVEDLGEDPIKFLEENIEEWNQETIEILEYWNEHNEIEKKSYVLGVMRKYFGLHENEIAKQISEQLVGVV